MLSKDVLREARIENTCERCGDNSRIVTRTDDGKELLCVFCMVKRYKEMRRGA